MYTWFVDNSLPSTEYWTVYNVHSFVLQNNKILVEVDKKPLRRRVQTVGCITAGLPASNIKPWGGAKRFLGLLVAWYTPKKSPRILSVSALSSSTQSILLYKNFHFYDIALLHKNVPLHESVPIYESVLIHENVSLYESVPFSLFPCAKHVFCWKFLICFICH